jgi:ribosomal protein L16/L10AE
MAGVDEELARTALTLAAAKLPIKTKFVRRIDPISGVEVAIYES